MLTHKTERGSNAGDAIVTTSERKRAEQSKAGKKEKEKKWLLQNIIR